jgi:flagellar biosynthesis anti-sigma factor FlgM
MANIRKTSGPRGIVTPFPGARARGAKPQPTGSGQTSDRVQTTDAALELSRAREHVRMISDAVSPRVEEIKRQIEAGDYNPDPREIAKAMLDHGFGG